MHHSTLTLSAEIADALNENRPVVALESTVITHGLPYPDNLAAARSMEQAVRDGGATPATIAILDGQIVVGIDDRQLERLASFSAEQVRKVSRRDLPIVVARGEHGATTVAGTMIVAHAAGIELFATGGIGGVHLGNLTDVSADLSEMGRTPVTIVCSGAKAILDLPATRERLETEGVTVVGYGCDEMPAFYMRQSGLPIDLRADSAAEVAALVRARRQLNIQSATLVTVPVPVSAELDAAQAQEAIDAALAEADAQHIRGAALSPFLLKRIVELTDGGSLRANTALLRNNAFTAAQIAAAL